MKNLILVGMTLLLAVSLSAAQIRQDRKAKPGATETVQIEVNSIQCGMCARAVQKSLKAVDGVESVKVDLDGKVAKVTYRTTKATLAQLETAITAAGYSANDRAPDPEAYEKLDDCCKLPQE